MGLLDILRHNKIKEPTFINEHEDSRLKTLEELLDKVGDDQKPLILNEMNLVKIGLSGEKNVIYELKHSKEPMLILHDISLPNVVSDSQIDFILITRNGIIVLETKKLSGDIIIDNEGNFTRRFKNSKGEVYKKEGIYSPLTQNKYHVEAIEALLKNNKFPRNIPIFSLLVIANEKSVVDKKYAQADVKKQIVKYDQLNERILSILNENYITDISDKVMNEIANVILENTIDKEYDYIKKFNLTLIDETNKEQIVVDEITGEVKDISDELYEKLRAYRLEKAKELKVQAFTIFTNEILEQLVLNKPSNEDEFVSIHGLGGNKYNLFGKDIIQIIHPDIIIEEKEIQGYKPHSNQIKKAIMDYRLTKAREINMPAYCIFNNSVIDEIVEKGIDTIDALKNVSKFG